MKVIVRCANNRVTKTEMEREIERLFQENKDLRVHVGHLRDELNLSQQQSEARRQVICERDKLIQELNDQIVADEEELANVKASVEIQRGFREEMAEEIEALEKELAKSESESSQGMNAMVKFWEEAVKEKNKAEERAEEYRIALMESDCRVDELEKQLAWVREEVARLTNERNTAVNENTLMTFDINELRDKCEVERNLRVEAEKAYEQVASEAYDMHQQINNLTVDNLHLKNRVEELEAEVDACRHNIDGYIEGNRRMRAEYEKKLETEQDQTKHWRKKYNDLKENYDELIQLHREWGEEIDRLRKVIIELQTNRFTTDEFIGMLLKNFMPSADK